MARALITMPKTAKRGELIEIRTLIAHPNVAFFTVATASGTLRFTWQGDNGFAQTESVELTVT
ncbi:MAG: hypothetical protein V4750_15635 [Pseudomonadota bacterium]